MGRAIIQDEFHGVHLPIERFWNDRLLDKALEIHKAFAVTVDSAGRIYATGQIQSLVNFGAGFTFGNGLLNMFVLALNADKSYRWKFRQSDSLTGQSIGQCISVSATEVAVGGWFGGQASFGDSTVNGLSGKSAFTVAYAA